jgi:hypothetical protein
MRLSRLRIDYLAALLTICALIALRLEHAQAARIDIGLVLAHSYPDKIPPVIDTKSLTVSTLDSLLERAQDLYLSACNQLDGPNLLSIEQIQYVEHLLTIRNQLANALGNGDFNPTSAEVMLQDPVEIDGKTIYWVKRDCLKQDPALCAQILAATRGTSNSKRTRDCVRYILQRGHPDSPARSTPALARTRHKWRVFHLITPETFRKNKIRRTSSAPAASRASFVPEEQTSSSSAELPPSSQQIGFSSSAELPPSSEQMDFSLTAEVAPSSEQMDFSLSDSAIGNLALDDDLVWHEEPPELLGLLQSLRRSSAP